MLRIMLFAVAIVLVFGGCSVNPDKVSPGYAKDFVNEATYVKDPRTGLCYSIVGVRKTGGCSQSSISYTYVPCQDCEHLLAK